MELEHVFVIESVKLTSAHLYDVLTLKLTKCDNI